jgi:hypothetical protein
LHAAGKAESESFTNDMFVAARRAAPRAVFRPVFVERSDVRRGTALANL